MLCVQIQQTQSRVISLSFSSFSGSSNFWQKWLITCSLHWRAVAHSSLYSMFFAPRGAFYGEYDITWKLWIDHDAYKKGNRPIPYTGPWWNHIFTKYTKMTLVFFLPILNVATYKQKIPMLSMDCTEVAQSGINFGLISFFSL